MFSFTNGEIVNLAMLCVAPTVNLQEFLTDYADFKEKIADMDQRLGTMVCIAFEECSCCSSAFKLVEMLGSLLERPLVSRDFQPKYAKLLSMFNKELDVAKQVFDKQVLLLDAPKGPVLNKNMPHVAGVTGWCHQLRERVETSMTRLKAINHGTMESAEAMVVFSKFDEMMQLIEV